MSYTTRCPACGTMFKVVPDQLKISDGWVRCGHCADVFDANLYLEAWAPPSQALDRVAEQQPVDTPSVASTPLAELPLAEVPSEEAQVSATAQTEMAQDRTLDAPNEVQSPADPNAGESSDWQRLSERVSTMQRQYAETQPMGLSPIADPETWAVEPQVPASPLEPATEFQADLARFAAASSSSTERIRNDPGPASEPMPSGFTEPLPDEDPPVEEPGFVRQARRQALWRSPGVRAALGLLGLLLAVLLAGQWALHERDRLAASHPDLAPLLARLCEPLGCDIGPVQRIDAVVIDSSTLVRRLGNFYSFDLVLKNTATMAVAVPALELTLTDSSDRVIARRVFLQQELPGSPELVPAQGNLALSLRLSINDVGAVPMAGYRALVFYP